MLCKARIIYKLHEKGVIKPSIHNGETVINVDLRQILAYPSLLNAVVDLMWDKLNHLSQAIDMVVGIADSTLLLANALGGKLKRRVLTVRMSKKTHTQKWVEGCYRVGGSCLLLTETIATGNNAFIAATHLKQVGLTVPFIVTFLKKEGDADARLTRADHELYSVFTEAEVLLYLRNQTSISAETSAVS
jgi:orotate phosphoribosyltransferase